MEEGKSYCVYRILDKYNNILYIGKSKQLETRIKNHIRGKSNLPEECRNKIDKVEYLEFCSKSDMSVFEIYAICYYKPEYNISDKDDLTLFKISFPEVWNELDINTYKRIVRVEPMGIRPKSSEYKFHFNKDIFLDENLSKLLSEYCDTEIDENKQIKLAQACGFESFGFDEINKYIKYNNPRMKLIKKDNSIILTANKNGANGFGRWTTTKIKNNVYIQCRISLSNNKPKCIYGKTKKEIADKIDKYLNDFYVVTQ